MNKELIKRFLMDRALGELPPETIELLEAYLADHPEIQSLADEINETVTLGERAVHADLPIQLPAFQKERMLSRSRPTGWNTAGRWISVAASLIIGFSIGISAKLIQDKPVQTNSGTFTNIQTQPVSGGLETARAFWSSKTYIERYQKNRKVRIQRNENPELQKQIQKFKMRSLL